MWTILTTALFEQWLWQQNESTQDKTLAALNYLRLHGPTAGRPFVDAIKGSLFVNMKELRTQSQGEPVRAFFAFDPQRRAVILCAGIKSGNDKRFYRDLIPVADAQFRQHLQNMEGNHDPKS